MRRGDAERTAIVVRSSVSSAPRTMSGPEDDATVVERAREDREDEKKVVDALRKDGTFEKFRKRVMEEVCAKARRRRAPLSASFDP